MHHQPPGLADRFLQFFCAPHLLEEVQGDLHEEFEYQVERVGIRRARWRYWRDMLGFLQPRYIKRKPSQYPQTYLFSLNMIRNYFKIAYRNLQRNKAYAFINVLGLALSMTCGILIFTLVNYHLSFDNFHKNSDRIYRIVTEMHMENVSYDRGVPAPLGQVFRNEHSFGEKTARIATFTDRLIILKKGSELIKLKEPEGIAFTEPSFFDIFNYPLLQGNKNTVLVEPNTAILTQKMAKKYFGDENPIGKEFWLENRIVFTVTGILKDLPPNTDRKTEIYVSYPTLKSYNSWLASDDSWGGVDDAMQCFTLLRPNVSATQAENAMAPYPKKYRPSSKNVHHYKLQPLSDIHFSTLYDGPMDKQNLWILSIIGFFLIITACVNFINLATAQALKRSKEVGVRKVLGGFKGQLFGQFITETAIISAISVVIAILLSFLILPYANDFFDVQMSLNLFSDSQLSLFIIALGVIVTFFAGSYPGLILAGFQPVIALKGKLSHQTIGGFNTRRALIVTQFAISQVLIIGMVVVIRQMQYAKQSDLGFDKDAIVMVRVGADSTDIKMKSLKHDLSTIAGVEKISLCRAAPSSGNVWTNSIRFDNQTEQVNFATNMKAGDEAYLSTFDLELVAGRNLFPSDSVKEFLVNETFTRKLNFSSPQEAIGKVIAANGGSMRGLIVGIIKDFHDLSFHAEINAVALTTNKDDYSNYAIKLTMATAKTTLNAIEKAWTAKFPDQIFEYEFLDESIAQFYETEERFLKLMTLFSLIAIFIGCLGLYGLVSFMAAQKTKEIGIRKVLGSSLAQILWIFGKEFARLIVVAFLVAAPIAWWFMNQWLQDFKFHITIQPWIFVVTIAITLLVATLTVIYEATKAALVNPVKSLKSE